MKMTRTTVLHGSFKSLLERAKTGDVIELYRGPYNDWCGDPDGVDIMRINRSGKKKCLVNGKRWSAGVWDNCDRPNIGEVWDSNGLHFTFGPTKKTILRRKAFPNNWQPHPKGIVRVTKSGILLNGKKIIFRGPVDEVKFHPNGALARLGNRFFLVVSKS